MASTVLGPTDNPLPWSTAAAVCEVKWAWADAWTLLPELELIACSIAAGGHGIDTASVRRRYGSIKLPFDRDFQQRGPRDLDRHWLRISLRQGDAAQPIWLGLIGSESRNLGGKDVGGPSGSEIWTAYGAQRIMEKIQISQSLWVAPPHAASREENWVDWLPGMNDRLGAQALLLGNRSRARHKALDKNDPAESYIHGDGEIWSAYDYLEYILAWWLDDRWNDGPRWSIDGQVDALKNLKVAQEWPEVTTVAHVVRTLVNPKLGIDYCIRDSGDGFTLHVYALQATATTVGGATLPKNPDTFSVRAGATPANISTQVERSSDHLRGLLRVLGKRIVVCTTIVGSEAIDPAAGSMVAGWPAALTDDYFNGVGPAPHWSGASEENPYPDGSDELKDFCRRSSRYRDVFQLWLCPPGFDLHLLGADVGTDKDGKLIFGDGSKPPPWQGRMRKTLHWLPLMAGWDYTVSPPVDRNDSAGDPDYRPQFLPPQLWLWNDDATCFYPANQAGVTVGVPKFGLGLRLQCHPRHLVAAEAAIETTRTKGRFKMSRSLATVAFESDQRLQLRYEVPDADPSVDGIEDIFVDDAELWVLAKEAVVAMDPSNALRLAYTTKATTLRDDRPRLAMIMAGAIARYASRRARASIAAQGLCAWQGYLGQILTVVDAGDAGERIDGAVTKIEWQGGKQPRTVLHAGYAGC